MARHLWKGICLNSRLFARQDQTISRICHSSRSSRSLQTGALQRRILLWTGGVFLGSAALTSAPLVVMAATTADEAAKVLQDPKWPADPPFEAEDFQKYDASPDTYFYSQPRFVTHIDDGAIGALTRYYAQTLPSAGTEGAAILDMCSSWISHYPQGYSASRITGMGMNEEELKRNSVLTDYDVKDLNEDPTLPYEDNTFDTITNVVSVDYLSKPFEIFKEMHRVLKPGGRAIMSFSNRCFPTKVPGGWSPPEAKDISPKSPIFGRTDPMYVVTATKV